MPEAAEEEALRQLKKLERMHPGRSETATAANWMEIMTDLPWSRSSVDNLDLKKAETVAQRRSLRSRESKDRIIEALACRKLKEKAERSDSLSGWTDGSWLRLRSGRSIARALDRSLCVCRSAACTTKLRFVVIVDLRRRDAGPDHSGRATGGTNNPVIMLDEIDKVGADFRGDPSSGSARSARSRTEQFVSRQLSRRHFRSLERDLHDRPPNVLDTIQPALRDRMEVIRLAGYTEEEKREIRHSST
jgi:ATP-dependent Lon protease